MKILFDKKEVENLEQNLYVRSISQDLDIDKNAYLKIVFNNNWVLRLHVIYDSNDGTYRFYRFEVDEDYATTPEETKSLNRFFYKFEGVRFKRVKDIKSCLYSFIQEFKDSLSETKFKFISVYDDDETFYGEELGECIADRIFVNNKARMITDYITKENPHINVLYHLRSTFNYAIRVKFESEFMSINGKHFVTKYLLHDDKTIEKSSIILDTIPDVYKYVISQIEIEYKKLDIDEGVRLFPEEFYTKLKNTSPSYRYSYGYTTSGETSKARAYEGDIEHTSKHEVLFFGGNFMYDIKLSHRNKCYKGNMYSLTIHGYYSDSSFDRRLGTPEPECIEYSCKTLEDAIYLAKNVVEYGIREVKDFPRVVKSIFELFENDELKNPILKKLKESLDKCPEMYLSDLLSGLLSIKRIADMEVAIADRYAIAHNNGSEESYYDFFRANIDNTIIYDCDQLFISMKDRYKMTQKEIAEITQLDLINKMIKKLGGC